MGLYIEVPKNFHKTEQLRRLYNAELIAQPQEFDPPAGKTFVCVVSNPLFDAAGICFDKREFEAFTDTRFDNRPRDWLLMDTEVVKRLNSVFAERYAPSSDPT
jgi:SAM-dependent MidA family methyltransferase